MNRICQLIAIVMVGMLGSSFTLSAEDVTVAGSLHITLEPEKPQILPGEPIFLLLTIENRSDTKISMLEGGNYQNKFGRDDNYKIYATDATGKAVPLLNSGASFGGMTSLVSIAPHEKRVVRFFLPDWASLSHDGTYALHLSTRLDVKVGEANLRDSWHDDPIDVAKDTSIVVLPADATKLGQVIDDIGTKLPVMWAGKVDGTEWLFKKLCRIEDPRAIPYLIRLADMPEEYLKSEALRALGKFPQDNAVEEVVKLSQTKASDFEGSRTSPTAGESAVDQLHHTAAAMLSTNPNPKAYAALLAMRHDRYMPVRMTVLQSLAQQTTEESLQVLKELATDTSPEIAKEAQRCIDARGKPPQP